MEGKQVELDGFIFYAFESLNYFVEKRSLEEEDEKDVALSNEDDICEWEMKLWRLVHEKEVRRSRYKNKMENKHRRVGKKRKYNYKLGMDMNEGLDKNEKTQEYTTNTRDDEGL